MARHKMIPFYMKMQFGEHKCVGACKPCSVYIHTSSMHIAHKAQSHQVEFNWLQLFNVVVVVVSLLRLPLLFAFPIASNGFPASAFSQFVFAVFITTSSCSGTLQKSPAISNYFHSIFFFLLVCRLPCLLALYVLKIPTLRIQ